MNTEQKLPGNIAAAESAADTAIAADGTKATESKAEDT